MNLEDRTIVPVRYRRHFAAVVGTGHDARGGWWDILWKCLHCGKVIKRNTAGAQSHITMHVRQKAAR
jgi:hypothetical protein